MATVGGLQEFDPNLAGSGPPALGGSFFILILIGLALFIPLVMALYFAPALIVHHDLGAVDAMKLSFKGCLRNILPFLVYGVIAMILGFLASIPLMLGWLVLGPILAIAVYVAYRQIFLDDTAI